MAEGARQDGCKLRGRGQNVGGGGVAMAGAEMSYQRTKSKKEREKNVNSTRTEAPYDEGAMHGPWHTIFIVVICICTAAER